MKQQQKIKNKLLATNLLATLFTMLVAAALWIGYGLNSYSRQFDERIEGLATLVSHSLTDAILLEDWQRAERMLSALHADTAVTSAKLYSFSSKKIIEHSFPSNSKQQPSLSILSPLLAGNSNMLDVFVSHSGETIATLEVHYQTNGFYDAFFDLLSSTLLVTVVAVILGTLLLSQLQSLVTRPLGNLFEITRRIIKTEDYSLRGQIKHPDEIGQITHHFNSILDIIERRDLKLERTVRQRNQQLEVKNQELEFQIDQRKKSEQAQREFESRFEQAFINAPIGMALVDKDQKILRYNHSFKQALDFTAGQPLCLKDFLGVRSYAKINIAFKSLLSDQQSFEHEAECRSLLGKPLEAILSFSVVNYDNDEFQYAVLQFQDITESKKMSQELEFQASHDVLTGLANRRKLKDVLSELSEQQDKHPFTLCILDLDQFKVVNDTCGHIAGDELLRQIARILKDTLPQNDLVVRLGGDEFAVLLYDCDLEETRHITEQIRQAVEQWHFIWEGQTFRVGVSVGAVVVNQQSVDLSKLMQQADAACFVAKDLGRNRVHIVDTEDIEVRYRQGEMRWVQRIHDAIENNKFILYSQPVVSLTEEAKKNRFEILLRLQDVETGEIIPPGAFMPAAERYSLMERVDTWVVSSLIAELQSNPSLREQKQSYWVNLSGLSLGNENFLAFLERSIRESELPHGMINFEITETAVMRNVVEAGKIMLSLKNLGCQFALDDFGSGMSSFGYLKNLPVDYIKIDGMFIRDILSDEVDFIFVKSIIDIAKTMGINTVAEFVESDAVCTTLEDIGADYAQGHYLGEPLPLIQQFPAAGRPCETGIGSRSVIA